MEPQPIRVGPFELRRLDDGSLSALHDRMRQPLIIPEAQIVRWLLQQARKTLATT